MHRKRRDVGESVQRLTTYGRCKRWGSALCLAAVIAAGVGLRMYGLYGRSIWFDEAFFLAHDPIRAA